MTYTAPLTEQRFALETAGRLAELAALPKFAAMDDDLVDAILTESGKFAAEVFAPLNWKGDREGAKLENGVVTLPEGFRDAYGQYVEAGWGSLGGDPEYGGQGLPFALATACQEQLTSANMAFSLCPMLTLGAIEALTAHASEDLKQTYLTKLVSGEWTGTMNLTEPQAGSDVGALRTTAEQAADGTWRIKGQKIYITWGEHDVADNIVHLVLARTAGAPAGTKGISLFVVPKYLPAEDGGFTVRNDLRCVGLEEKLGIHASPTCTMSFGDKGECVGFIVGEEMAGMRAMFTMMNHARVNVGLQGPAICERAYQAALAYAKERVQSAKLGGPDRDPVAIVEHADVRRNLMTMKAITEATRALVYANAAAVDMAHAQKDADARTAAQGRADLLTPITKGYATDMGVEVASIGVQVHGGMGFVEETGAAQHYRDIRIAPIYEGTNGIQAMDLVGRKLNVAGGQHWRGLLAEMRADIASLPATGDFAAMKVPLSDIADAVAAAANWLVEPGRDPNDVAAGAQPFLRLFGIAIGGWLLAGQAREAQSRLALGKGDAGFLRAKVVTARFFAEQVVPQGAALLGPVMRGRDTLFAISADAL
ncbi:acyl-CoA dehydrogenase C-terminal domain-containing protein [Pacificimonas sp. WHA3]|uniref:Acyl-CoA dehydrogenase C-terminal domain-containing protein n=1 Tax=Pacificimonas pallii TaxID=2827236 RepID=A0ABS6SEJ7_9SPHN|nr:acyl-CoA dehydrogenase C-terminal domain-containing protein [Pacificimonas pallii]MBV7256361.1 acyl-CoA dehydrogenase C-terminal domain-containing protein [Pacificimonas pallii]